MLPGAASSPAIPPCQMETPAALAIPNSRHGLVGMTLLRFFRESTAPECLDTARSSYLEPACADSTPHGDWFNPDAP